MIKSCRRYWTKEIADSIVQLKNIRFVNPQYDLRTTFDRFDFTQILQDTFEIAKDKIEDFYDHLRKMDYFEKDGRTIGDLLEEFFPGRDDVKRCFWSLSLTQMDHLLWIRPLPMELFSRISCERVFTPLRMARIHLSAKWLANLEKMGQNYAVNVRSRN